jgi:hypothetical protein
MANIANQHNSGNKETICRKAKVAENINAAYEGPFTRNVFNSTTPRKQDD